MISAKQAVEKMTSPLTLDRMLMICDKKVKEAIAENKTNCAVLFSKQLYSEVDLRNLREKLSQFGYGVFSPIPEHGANSVYIELRW